jgi:hypothetical protein
MEFADSGAVAPSIVCGTQGNYSEWLSSKERRLRIEDRAQAGLLKTIEKELEWVGKAAKGQQKKGAARLRRYDDLVAEAAAYVKDTQVSCGQPHVTAIVLGMECWSRDDTSSTVQSCCPVFEARHGLHVCDFRWTRKEGGAEGV